MENKILLTNIGLFFFKVLSYCVITLFLKIHCDAFVPYVYFPFKLFFLTYCVLLGEENIIVYPDFYIFHDSEIKFAPRDGLHSKSSFSFLLLDLSVNVKCCFSLLIFFSLYYVQ